MQQSLEYLGAKQRLQSQRQVTTLKIRDRHTPETDTLPALANFQEAKSMATYLKNHSFL